MRATLSRFYGWSPDDVGRLTIRQARNYYEQIGEMGGTASGEASSGEQDWDLNEIFDEADDLRLKPPAR